MRILGIDPSNDKASYVLWDTNRGIQQYAHNEDKDKFKHRHCISDEDMCLTIETLMMLRAVDLIAIETIESRGMLIGKTTLDTMFNVGRFFQVIEDVNKHSFTDHGLKTVPSMLIQRREEKLLLCGSMKAKDSNIAQYLKDTYGQPGTKKDPGYTYGIAADNWQAFGVAVTAYTKYQQSFR